MYEREGRSDQDHCDVNIRVEMVDHSQRQEENHNKSGAQYCYQLASITLDMAVAEPLANEVHVTEHSDEHTNRSAETASYTHHDGGKSHHEACRLQGIDEHQSKELVHLQAEHDETTKLCACEEEMVSDPDELDHSCPEEHRYAQSTKDEEVSPQTQTSSTFVESKHSTENTWLFCELDL